MATSTLIAQACGAFCEAAKAINHCKFCKCRACSFCANVQRTPFKSMLKKRASIGSKPSDGISEGPKPPSSKKVKRVLKGMKKAAAGGVMKKAKKRKLIQPGTAAPAA